MSENSDLDLPRPLSRQERAAAVAKALGEAARRTRLSKKNKRHLATDRFRGQRSERVFRLIKRILFVTVFVLPSLSAVFYYAFIASDQFTAESRFTLRGGMPPKLDTLGLVTGLPPAFIMQDTQVILNYIMSRAIIDDFDKTVSLKSLYGQSSIDYFSRLSDTASIEKTLKYWKSMVHFTVHMPDGIVVLKVRAFSPTDAVRIADATLKACEELVNAMNARMIEDTLAASEMERMRSQTNLAQARARLESSRNMEGLLSADSTEKALDGLIANVRRQLGEMRQEYEVQRLYVSEEAPQIRNLNIRIDAANAEIKALQAKLTGASNEDGSQPLTRAMSNLNYLQLENKIAEKIYASSLALLEHARLASEAKLLYLNIFVRPQPAEEPNHALRWQMGILSILGSLAAWFILNLVLNLVRKTNLFRYGFGVEARQ